MLSRPFFIPLHPLRHTDRGFMTNSLHSKFKISGSRCIRCSTPILPSIQIRHASRRPTRPPIVTSFPQFTPRPLRPLYQNKVFWGGIGFIGLLIWSPVPGWILLGGIGYGFYRLFRYLKRAQDVIFGRGSTGVFSTSGEGTSLLDSIFAQDPQTREIAAKIQEMAMERVEMAIQVNEEGIRKLFPTTRAETSGEFHFTFPTEVTMVNSGGEDLFRKTMVEVMFEIQIKFMVYLATDEGRRGAQIIAKANVVNEGVQLNSVDIRELKGSKRVRLKGLSEIDVNGGEKVDSSGVGKGEGEGKTIDATKWTSK